jgi:hypothetical protein
MATYLHTGSAAMPRVARQAAWFVVGSAVAFAVPYLGVSVLDLQHDVYYGMYFAVTLVVLGAYVRSEHIDVLSLFTRHWISSLVIGVPIGVFVVWNVFRTDSGTPRPHGAYFAFEVAWRGVGYGVIDALLLTAFPCLVAFNMMHGRIDGFGRRLGFIALALPLIWVITAGYHLGYPQFREDGVQKPETGNTLISVPMLATMNPVGSIAAHVAMHVTAVTHAYETNVFLPPQTDD